MVVTPRGQVLTFLFSDVEASTTLWEHEPESMAQALHQHDVMAEQHVLGNGGHIFKHTGDGFIAAFAAASDGIDAAVSLMQAIQATPFEGLTGPFAVRMGLHTGEASERDGDYFGRSLNRAARVMAAANGNQIVVSKATAELSEHRELVDHGVHELRGIGTERLFTVVDEKLMQNPKPLRVVRATNLPVITDEFVGRAGEVDTIVERVRSNRCVTLTGPGGVGKTRLAISAAKRMSSEFPDGTWFCRLDKANDPESALAVIAETLAVPPLLGKTVAESIGKHLGQQTALIVLDNCEHVLDEARQVADAIITEAPTSAVLATSRERLRRAGEHTVPIVPLDPATDGYDLLLRRARERDPDFELPRDEESMARTLAAQLDGLPLAIELAAARLSVLSPSAILDRLTDRFRLLRDGSEIDRQTSLLATIQWSFDLLDDRARRLFRRLSVFRGGFTLEAAAAICGLEFDELETLDVLHQLVEKSMINHGREMGNDRFSILESLHTFGRQQLAESGEEASVKAAHVRWFTELATTESTRLQSDEETVAWERLTLEWDNLRLAFQRAMAGDDLTAAAAIVSSVHYFSVVALRFEGLSWSEQWLDHAGAADHPDRNLVVAALSSHAYYQMDFERSRDIALDLLDNDHGVEAMPLIAIWTLLAMGDTESAQRFVAGWEEKTVSRSTPFQRSLVAAAGAVLNGTMLRNPAETDRYLAASHAEAEASGAPSACAYADMVEGMACGPLDPDRALLALGRAESAARRLSDRHAYIDGAQTANAQIMAAESDLDESLRRTNLALESAAQHHFLPRIAHDLQSAALTLARAGDPATGALLLGACRAQGQRSWKRSMAIVTDALGTESDELLARGEQLTLYEAAAIAIEAIARARGAT